MDQVQRDRVSVLLAAAQPHQPPGRQILAHGKRLDPRLLVERIQAVTAADVARVMRAALAAPPRASH